MPLKEYLAALDAQYRTGAATEHSYRPALQQYLQALLPGYLVTNEPTRTACGAPDYVITTRANGLPVAYVEAKDIDDPDLKGLKAHREQFDRYRGALERIVFTDYLQFHLYIHGELAMSARVGEADGRRIHAAGGDPEGGLVDLVAQLVGAPPKPIANAGQLAELMAGKARMLRAVIGRALEQGDASAPKGATRPGESAPPRSPGADLLYAKYLELKEKLIRDLKREEFADVYAQTIVYGLFAARLHCPAGRVFERAHLADLVPATNPLLRAIFLDLIVVNPEPRIAWLVDDLVEMFAQTDTDRMLGCRAGRGAGTARGTAARGGAGPAGPLLRGLPAGLRCRHPQEPGGVVHTGPDSALHGAGGGRPAAARFRIPAGASRQQPAPQASRGAKYDYAPRADPRPGHGHRHLPGRGGPADLREVQGA